MMALKRDGTVTLKGYASEEDQNEMVNMVIVFYCQKFGPEAPTGYGPLSPCVLITP